MYGTIWICLYTSKYGSIETSIRDNIETIYGANSIIHHIEVVYGTSIETIRVPL